MWGNVLTKPIPNCLMENVPRITPENPMWNRKCNSHARSWHEGLQMAAATRIEEVLWKLLFNSFLFTTETKNKQKGNWKCYSSPDAGLRVTKEGLLAHFQDVIPLDHFKTFKKFETVGWNFGPKIVARGTTKILENLGKWKHIDNGLTKKGLISHFPRMWSLMKIITI